MNMSIFPTDSDAISQSLVPTIVQEYIGSTQTKEQKEICMQFECPDVFFKRGEHSSESAF